MGRGRLLKGLCLTIAAFAGMATVTFAAPPDPVARSAEQRALPAGVYLPMILVGAEDTPEKIFFYWFASKPQSGMLFRAYIKPLLATRNEGRIAIALIQVFEPDAQDVNGPGGLMLCAKDSDQYLQLLDIYLTQEKDFARRHRFFKATEQYFSNAPIDWLQASQFLDFKKCIVEPLFQLKSLTAIGFSKRILQGQAPPYEPFIVYGGKRLKLGDRDLEKVKALGGQ